MFVQQQTSVCSTSVITEYETPKTLLHMTNYIQVK